MHGWIRISIFDDIRRRLSETKANNPSQDSPTGVYSFVNVGSVGCLERGETITCMWYAALAPARRGWPVLLCKPGLRSLLASPGREDLREAGSRQPSEYKL